MNLLLKWLWILSIKQVFIKNLKIQGNSAKNVTLGVPRIKEILNAGKNIKTPGMTIFIKPDLIYGDPEKYVAKI